MSKQLSELCTILVDETFGGLPSALFSCLIARGRLTLPQLLQVSKLSPRYLKHALAVLVQLRLVSYYTSPDDGATYYEANVRNAYDLVRVGKHAQLAESQYGKNSAAIVSTFQCHGLVSPNDLLNDISAGADPSEAKAGAAPSDPQAPLSSTNSKDLNLLFSSRHIVKARDLDFIPAPDFDEMVENMVQDERFPAGPKGKQKIELARSVLSRKRRWRDDNQASLQDVKRHRQSHNNAKQATHVSGNETAPMPSATLSTPNKRRRLNGGLGYGSLENGVNHNEVEHNSVKHTSPQQSRKRHVAGSNDTSPRSNKRQKQDDSVALTADTDLHNAPNSQTRARGGNKANAKGKASKVVKSNGIANSENNSIAKDHENSNDGKVVGNQKGRTSRIRAPREPLKPTNNRKRNATNAVTQNNDEDEEKYHESMVAALDGENFVDTVGVAGVSVDDSATDDEQSEDFEEQFFRLSTEKFSVSMRSQRLVELATKHLGEPTSKVFAALLRCLERKIARCYDEYTADNLELDEEDLDSDDDEDEGDKHTVSTVQIDDELDPKLDLSWSKESDKAPKDKANAAASVRADRIHAIEQHLYLLAEHAHQFVHPVDLGRETHWHVDFDDLTSLLIRLEIEDVISTRFDEASARIVRYLSAKGKLDEKRLADLTLILQKDLRSKLATLQAAGYVDLQEVPRDIGRQPSRTIFLWYFDPERCRKLVLDDTYKIMARLLQRARVEKEKVQSVIEKSERTDVVGREDKYLSTTEKAALKEWHRKEEMIWTQVFRLDDMVALLRDYLAPSMM